MEGQAELGGIPREELDEVLNDLVQQFPKRVYPSDPHTTRRREAQNWVADFKARNPLYSHWCSLPAAMQHEVYELFAEGVSRNMKDLARKKAKFDVSKCFPTSEELSALWRQYTMYHAAVQHSYRNQQHVMHPLPVPKQFVPSSRGPLGQPQSQAPTVLNATRASDPPQVQSASQDVPLGPFGTLPEDPSDYFPLN